MFSKLSARCVKCMCLSLALGCSAIASSGGKKSPMSSKNSVIDDIDFASISGIPAHVVTATSGLETIAMNPGQGHDVDAVSKFSTEDVQEELKKILTPIVTKKLQEDMIDTQSEIDKIMIEIKKLNGDLCVNFKSGINSIFGPFEEFLKTPLYAKKQDTTADMKKKRDLCGIHIFTIDACILAFKEGGIGILKILREKLYEFISLREKLASLIQHSDLHAETAETAYMLNIIAKQLPKAGSGLPIDGQYIIAIQLPKAGSGLPIDGPYIIAIQLPKDGSGLPIGGPYIITIQLPEAVYGLPMDRPYITAIQLRELKNECNEVLQKISELKKKCRTLMNRKSFLGGVVRKLSEGTWPFSSSSSDRCEKVVGLPEAVKFPFDIPDMTKSVLKSIEEDFEKYMESIAQGK